MKRLLPLLLLLPLTLSAQVGIGQWRSHLSYRQMNRLCLAGDVVYAAAPQGLIAYDRQSGLVEKLDKTHTLNDVGIATMVYDPGSDYLVVAYTNSNIDLLHQGRAVNISDIKRSSLSGDKSIHSVRFHQRRAYVACAFGIVVVNLERGEIEDTWYIGPEGAHSPVYDLAFHQGRILAAMEDGIRCIDQGHRFPHIAANWSLCDTLRCLQMEPWQDTLLFRTASDSLRSLRVCGDHIVRSYADRVTVDNSTVYQSIDWLSNMNAHDALLCPDGTLLVAHDWAGLISIRDGILRSHTPSSPLSDHVYALVPHRARLLLCHGGKTSTYRNAYLPARLSLFADEQWATADMAGLPIYDLLSVAANPRNAKQMLAASWGYGIVELQDNAAVELFDESNTPAIEAYTQGSFRSLRTGGVCFDPQGNAWMTNSKVDNGLMLRKKDGSWQSFYTRNMTEDEDVDKILYDTVHRLVWFCGHANRLFVADADGRTAWVDPNQGAKMETSAVTCMALDHNGTLWFGTNKGLKIITNPYQAFANGGQGERSPVQCSNITISNNAFAEYLMAYESITALAVDGANRKWVGTSNGGLYLISENGQEEIQHFTVSNSPLFSNKITAIGVMPETGEVFIGTPLGTQSFRSTATYAAGYAQPEIQVFPNPVEPGYEGPIAVRGFARNSLIHISDAAGHVLFSGRADGGQVVWNGRTLQGQPAPSGVYFVFASDDQGQNRAVGKILIVR